MVSLHICTSASWGGLELYAGTLMAEVQNAGCRVIAVCAVGSPLRSFLVERGIDCRAFPGKSKISPASVRYLRRLLDEEHVSIVHVHFHNDIWIPSIAMRGDAKRKLFLSIYMGVMSKNDPFHRWIYGRVDAIFTSSEELNARLPELYPVPPRKIHLLRYGRNLELYVVDQVKRRNIRLGLGIGDGEILAGTMARIDPGKGALDFAQSILYLDPDRADGVKYLLVGEPTRKARRSEGESPYEPHCEEYLESIRSFIEGRNLGRKILLAGFQSDLIGYLSAMDIFVFPSRDEMYSLVVLDAMCMGLPVVAARAGGNIRQIEDGTSGVLYDVGDSRDLAAKLTRYLEDPFLRRQHGAAARKFVEERHSMKETVTELLRFYDF